MPPRLPLTLGAALLTVAVSSVTALAAGPYPPPSTASATVNPSRIKAGQCTTFTGHGFAPAALVDVRDDGASAGSATADRNGSARLRLCYGTDARTGQHVISGTGSSPQGTSQTVSAVLTITGVEQSGGGQQGGTTTGAASGGSTGTGGTATGIGITGPAGVSTDGLGSVPRTNAGGLSGAAGGTENLASSGLRFEGIAGLAWFLGFLLALVSAAWLLLLLGRRRSREREDEPQPQLA